MVIDGKAVADIRLHQPVPFGHVGLHAWGTSEVRFRDMEIDQLRGEIFVVMEFSQRYLKLHRDVITPVAEDLGLKAYNVGELFKPGMILQDIAQGIRRARLVIAEVSPPNQNVYYELGFAHALGKPTLLLAQEGTSLPFDISVHRCLFYRNDEAGMSELTDRLRQILSGEIAGEEAGQRT
jgi:hypothetical protein